MAGNERRNSRSQDSVQRKLEERRAARGHAAPADWGGADAARVVALISTVTRAGGLCSFGYTRDGGTYSVTVIVDGERFTDYCRPTEDLDNFLDVLRDDYEGLERPSA